MTTARILIVEDEYLVAANLEAVLEDLGHEPVGIAPDMDAALTLAATKPDLALVDIHLRDGETGPVIAERLRREHGIAVLFVTANPRMAAVAADVAIGVLGKPLNDGLLAQAVAYALSACQGAPLPSPPAGLTLLSGAA